MTSKYLVSKSIGYDEFKLNNPTEILIRNIADKINKGDIQERKRDSIFVLKNESPQKAPHETTRYENARKLINRLSTSSALTDNEMITPKRENYYLNNVKTQLNKNLK